MATERPDRIPETKSQWKARHKQLTPKPLHEWENLRSASEITEKQFLALRVIWPTRMSLEDFEFPIALDADIGMAAVILGQLEVFQNFIKYIKGHYTRIQHRGDSADRLELGVFASARRHQLETIRKVKDATEEEGDTEMPDEPEPRERPQPGLYKEETVSTKSGDTEPMEISPTSNFSPSMQGSLFECAEDMPGKKMETIGESIVNNAAIQLLAAICEVTADPTCEFLDYRGPFEKFVSLGNVSMEARVDGVLQGREIPDIFAIVEVKPRFRRRKSILKILWQESAEFVAWINHDLKNKRVVEWPMRLLIAQNHDEIYLCVAEYDEGYIKFLAEGDDSTDSFLSIQEYGPFHIRAGEDMKKLAHFIYAYCQAVTDHINSIKPQTEPLT
ncbi:hypothetical protein N7501_002214 [Penicillium viridicatum]|nr:hypothetical protein N7501_002214 [Penicillium viridicatum]